ncbi:regulatory protein RecX [Methylocaldum sp. MU1018]
MALRYLSHREYSNLELRQKLCRKGYPEAVVEQVVADLVSQGFQSDSRFAEVFARSRAERGYGLHRIRQELRLRGVDTDGALESARDWDNLIRKIYVKKYGETLPESFEERAARERFLRRRGFEADQIRRLFKSLRHVGGD